MTWIGIDPGITGAIAFLGEPMHVIKDLPVEQFGVTSKVKNQVSGAVLAQMIKNTVLFGAITKAFVERVSSMPKQGVASTFSMGQSFGTILGVLGALIIPVHIITPGEWKRFYNLGSDKEASRTKALHLFPELAKDLSRKKDHNRAEALLIAHWARLKHHES